MNRKRFTDYEAILPRGKANAISTNELCMMLGFENARALQQDIAKSRENGQVILSSSSGGYFAPANDDEIQEFIAVLRSRAISTFRALKSAKEALAEHRQQETGQMSIDDFSDIWET